MRRRVSLAGHVIAASGASRAASAEQLREVQLGMALALAEDWRAARGVSLREVSATSADLAHRNHAQVRSDGLYFFFDLPAGNYVLEGKDERGHRIETKPVSIPQASGPGTLPVLGVDLIARANQEQTADSPVAAGQRTAPAKRRRGSDEESG